MTRLLSKGLVALTASLVLGVNAGLCSPLPPVGSLQANGLQFFREQHSGLGHGQSYLGVDVRDVNDDELSSLKLKEARGAEIIHVDHDGPAGKMGLRERDVVTQMNGTAIEGEDQIRRMLRDTAPGRTVVFVLLRDGQQMIVTAQMADREEVERQAWARHLNVQPGPAPDGSSPATDESSVATPVAPAPAPKYSKSFLGSLLTSPTYTGAMLERVGPQLASFFGVSLGTGLLVRGVDNNSPAAMSGIRAGDVVIRANARTLVNMTDWAKIIRDAKGRPVTVVLVRDRQEKTMTLTPDVKRHSCLQMPDLPGARPVSAVLAKLTEL